jgi:transposase
MRVWRMRKRITIDVSDTDRDTLTAIVTDRNSPQKHVWRAQIVLLTADGCGTMELTRRTGTSKTSVWRWQERFVAEGVPGLLRDKTRPSRIPPLGAEVEARVVAATQTAAPGETTHWTSVAMARHIGISITSVQRIWRKHGLQPHRVRQFKLSNDPRFAAKLLDIVGLYVAPPEHAVVLSIDEKSQIQALDRTQPGLPMKKGRCGTMTHMWTASSSQGVLQCFDQIACVHMSGLLSRSRVNAGQDGLRDANSKHDCDLWGPLGHSEYFASWIDRSHHLLIILQVLASAQHGCSSVAPHGWLISSARPPRRRRTSQCKVPLLASSSRQCAPSCWPAPRRPTSATCV